MNTEDIKAGGGRTPITPRNHNTPCSMPEYSSLDEWTERAAELRKIIMTATGLWPVPDKNRLNFKIFGRKEGEGYSLEKVYMESRPGYFLCGNLYRPNSGKGPFPGILCPHGHFQWGRLGHNETGSIPGACISLARLGFVAFSYDMIGYNDTLQIPHSFGGKLESLWGVNLMGLQLWNSIRALDFLSSLEDVDPLRLGCAGASGGGTQTFMLSAVDERVRVSAPAVMISAHMQGGCGCENAPGLRIETNNMEIASLAAPRPMLMVAATGDWTRNTPEVEYPAVKSVYDLYDASDNLEFVIFEAPHNFNKKSREAIYAWFGKWLMNIDDPEKFREPSFQPDQPREMLVFYGRELPESMALGESAVNMLLDEARDRTARSLPKCPEDMGPFRETLGVSFKKALAARMPNPEHIKADTRGAGRIGDFRTTRLMLGDKDDIREVPAMLIAPENPEVRAFAIIVHDQGIASVADEISGEIAEDARKLLHNGISTLALDCFNTGGAHGYGEVEGIRHFDTYNRTTLSMRINDILLAASYLLSVCNAYEINIIGYGEGGLWSLLASSLLSEHIRRSGEKKYLGKIIVDADGFNNNSDDEYADRLYAPGLRSAGDLRTALLLANGDRVTIHNTRGKLDEISINDMFDAIGTRPPAIIEKRLGGGDVMRLVCDEKFV